jgi:uncharacterized protein YjbJ (UPF0337 family)
MCRLGYRKWVRVSLWGAKSAADLAATRSSKMNNERMKGNWNQFKGKIKEKWGRLTDDDLDVAEGHRDQLIGRIQERYGLAKEEAERQFSELEEATYSSRV